jgi:transmembrane sensor
MKEDYPLFKIAALIAKEKSGSLASSEKEILHQWLLENDHNKTLYDKLRDGETLINDLTELKSIDTKKAYSKIEGIIKQKGKPVKTYRFIPAYSKYAAAIVALAVCSFFIIHHFSESKTNNISQHIFFPGKTKAILITANSREIVLDSSINKQTIKDAQADIAYYGSTLSYNKSAATNNEVTISYNTLITPRGSEYTVILSDGTEVTLNAGSKLKYPVVFTGSIREVELEGEAFFKVKKSLTSPFIVKANEVNVKVYGTIFNVSAYNNESLVKTTLIEGSVGVSIRSSKTISELKIKPGQQFTYNKVNENSITEEVDTDRYVAWTKGMFMFENEPIENILKVMSRWYNFDFEFKDDNLRKQRFTLNLGRYYNANKIFDMISISSKVKFAAKGNLITVYSE